MELRDFRLFVGVAEAGGIRRAAAQLGIRQSVISHRLRSLEEILGASLFERTREGVRLTYAGSRFLADVRSTLAQVDDAVRRVRAIGSAADGRIRLGTVASVSGGFLSQLLRDWRVSHPCVSLQIEAAFPRENLARVVSRELDIAIVTGAPQSRNYEIATLWTEDVFAVVSNQHPLANRTGIALSELQNDRFIVTKQAPGPEIHDWVISRLSSLSRSVTIDEQAVGRDTLLSLVGLGFGVSMASYAETEIRYPNVSFVRIENEELPFSVVWSPANDNPALRRFLSDARLLSKHYSAQRGMRDPSP